MEHLEFAPHAVSLLDADADLATGIDPSEYDEARRRAAAHVLEVDGPKWDPSELCKTAGEGWLGLFVIDGLLVRRVNVAGRAACEIFGAGDILRPWDEDGEYEPLVIEVSWRVLEPTRLALLDTAFALRVARWPSIQAQLISRVARRARHLALLQAVTHLPRVHTRLVLLFWLLAERWGRFGPDGVRVQMPLTHETLAMLVGAQRPSVTVALQRLAHADLLLRPAREEWVLTRLAVERLRSPESLELLDAVSTVAEADTTF
jgi:hypothetical protein